MISEGGCSGRITVVEQEPDISCSQLYSVCSGLILNNNVRRPDMIQLTNEIYVLLEGVFRQFGSNYDNKLALIRDM